MLKNKNAFKYLALSLLLYGLFIGGELLLEHFRKMYIVSYEGVFIMIGLMILIPLLIGVLLGIEYLLTAAYKMEGAWKINWYRLFILGVPALIIVLNFVFTFLGIHSPVYNFHKWPMLIKTEVVMLSSLILGYVLGSSFYRGKSSQ